MKKIHLNLYSGYYNYRGYKFAKVLINFYDEIYLSGINKKSKKTSTRYNDLYSNKIKPIHIKKKNYFFWLINHIKFFKKKKIVSISVHNVYLIPLGVVLKFFFKSKLIYEPHELETETIAKNNLKKLLAKCIEKIFINFFDHITVVSPSIAKWYENSYRVNKPSVIINSRNYHIIKKKNYFRNKFKINKNKKIFLYSGNLNERGRGLHKVLNCFAKDNSKNNVVIFMGKGKLTSKIKKYSNFYENIFYHEPVLANKLHEYTSSADVGFCLYENNCLNQNYCLPNKLFEYISGGIPVVVSNNYEFRNFIRINKCGYIFKFDEDLNSFLNRLSFDKNFKFKKKNAKIAALKYSWEFEEKKIMKIYKKILKR